MANNSNKHRGKPRAPASAQQVSHSSKHSSTARRVPGPSSAKPPAPKMQPAEPVAAPVVQTPPLESTVEAWADPIADNSSYATAESDDPPSGLSTPPAAASSTPTKPVPAVAQAAEVAPPPALPETLDDEPVLAAAVPPAARVLQAVPAAPEPSAKAPAAAAAAPSPVAPCATPPQPQPVAPSAAALTVDLAGQCLSWLLRAYTFPVYLAAGVTAGVVQGMRDQLQHH